MSTSTPTRRSATRRRPMQLTRPAARPARTTDRTAGDLRPAAATSIAQVAATVELLTLALEDDVSFFAGLLRRGMLDAAIEHAAFAAEALRAHDDPAAAGIERSVLAPLVEARRATLVADADPERLAGALQLARSASRALATDH